MKVGFLYPKSEWAAWSLTHGITNTLRAMGHEVVPGEMPTEGIENLPRAAFDRITAKLPALKTLKECDAVLISGPEHIAPWLNAVYGKYEWKNLGVPKAAWWHESMFREDYTLDWDNVGMWADENFVPAYQDADWLSQPMFAGEHVHWLPFGVDTEVFRPYSATEECYAVLKPGLRTSWPIAFVGLVYDKRAKFLDALSQCNIPAIRIGNVKVQDLAGLDPVENVQRLANNYRRIGVFFNLPAMSKLLVTKIYEVMACGTFVLTPMLANEKGIEQNMKPFHDREHLVYYRGANLVDVARALRHWSAPENQDEREKIAAAGCKEVHEKHSLRVRLETILSKMGVEVVQ